MAAGATDKGYRSYSTSVKSTEEGMAEKMEDVIPVVILNWNGENDTLECLRSIRKSVPAGFLPVVVDNGSNPASVERLKHECGLIFSDILYLREGELSLRDGRDEFSWNPGEDSLVFIENGQNRGFAGGSNVGIKFAELAGATWVMLLNNDTVIEPEAFCELRRFMGGYPSFAAMTPQIRHYQPRTRVQNCGGDLTFFGSRRYKFANRDVSGLPESDFSVITFITGCALLFKYKAVGTLTEDFFFGEEDYELSLRIRKLGLKMACVHGAVVYHKLGASIGKASRPLGAILVQYVSRLINVRNYYPLVRWQLTRILAYAYLPVLFARNGIDPRRSMEAIRRVQSYLKNGRGVGRAEFQEMIGLQ